MRDYKFTVTLVAMFLFVIVIGVWHFNNMNECSEKGGDYLNGAFGYTCVGEDRE